MIHTASLVHDDVLDECDMRRGEGRRVCTISFISSASPPRGPPLALYFIIFVFLLFFFLLFSGQDTVNSKFGTRVAVLAGDFLFAQSSWLLANLNNLEVRLLLPLEVGGCVNRSQASPILATFSG